MEDNWKWKFSNAEGVLLSDVLSKELTEEAKLLRNALAPVEVLPMDRGPFSGFANAVRSALVAQRALLARVLPDTEFELVRSVPGDVGRRHRCAWRPRQATDEQFKRWLETVWS